MSTKSKKAGKRRFVSAICLAILALVTLLMIFLTIKLAPTLTDNSVDNNNHVVSGNLQMGANIVKQEGEIIEHGAWKYWEDKTRINLQQESDPIFDWPNATPGTWTRVTIEVENLERGLDAIGFTYKVRIMNLKGKSADGTLDAQDTALAEQLKITVQNANGVTHAFNLVDCSKEENYVALGSIDVGADSQQFTIKVEFANATENDDVQGGQVIFDLQIIATQYLPQGVEA